MADPKTCADCGCELDDEEDTYCEDCLYADDEEDSEDEEE
jgi:NMD protein affecting ribosome stability and mRNA decay